MPPSDVGHMNPSDYGYYAIKVMEKSRIKDLRMGPRVQRERKILAATSKYVCCNNYIYTYILLSYF